MEAFTQPKIINVNAKFGKGHHYGQPAYNNNNGTEQSTPFSNPLRQRIDFRRLDESDKKQESSFSLKNN